MTKSEKAAELVCLMAGHDPGWKRIPNPEKPLMLKIAFFCLRCGEKIPMTNHYAEIPMEAWND